MIPFSSFSVDLTPTFPVTMGGHGGPARLTERVHGHLEANVFALGSGLDTVVIVSVDALFIGAQLRDIVLQACADRFGIGPERVLVLASHTHTAPMLDASKPRLGHRDERALVHAGRVIADAIKGLDETVAASIDLGEGACDLAVNRRLRWRLPTLVRLLGKVADDIYICDNPSGPRDRRIRTAIWRSHEGQPLAMLWSFACHPSGFPAVNTASPDYVGVVREACRLHLSSRVPVIFAPGCMGDVRPRSAQSWKGLRRLPALFLYGPQPSPMDEHEWKAWSNEVAGRVVEVAAAGKTEALSGTTRAFPMVREPMSGIFDGSCPTPELHLKAVDLPGFGRIVTMSCEPVTEIARVLGAGERDLVLGYEGDVFGYLPTDAMIAEGGYEARRFMSHFGLSGSFRSDLDNRVAQLGRKLLGDNAVT